ncbi:hypothetical protein RND71_019938 [Anisodus tanguticus]|uniref:Uncharacterized protein n=1 Tax=Anisodus tanguticus TaxID=243964 RepID=A0AAE1VEW8_9SOLA|nr:hypothetical protein RND71_019938 [Anisodus tanguticus]
MGKTAMSFLKWLVILLFQFYYLFNLSIAQPKFISSVCSKSNNTDFSPNSAYDTNLNTILSSVSRNIDSVGFYNSSIGQNSDTVSVIAQCRGDVQLQRCRDCINNATRKILEVCPYKKSAVGYYGRCLLRYSNESIIGTVSTDPQQYVYLNANASSPDEFMQDLRTLLESLRSQASRGSMRKYASNNTQGPDFQTIFALVQCTADLSAESCINCLSAGYRSLPTCPCYGKQGLNFRMPSCNFRYETYSFFDELPTEAPPPPMPPPPPPPPSGKDDKTAQTVIIVVLTVTVVIFVVCISVILMKRQKRKMMDEIQSIRGDDTTSSAESLQWDFSKIRVATDNFSNANKLGQGGFGPVYKGKLLNGQEVAVKRLAANSGQGDPEFKNEVLLVARLEHKNLVRLLGFCLDRTERLLVYEFVRNASLDHFLFEYAMRGKFSVKSDVFSFGVLVLEILSGQKNTCFINGEYVGNLLSYAWRNWREGTAINFIDPMLRGTSGLVGDIMRCIHIALLCIQENAADRPTMAAVVLMLSSLSMSLSVPSRPAYYMHNDDSPRITPIQDQCQNQLAKNKSRCLSQNEMSVTELCPR